MPVNGINVGKDYVFGLYDSTTETLVELGDVQDVKISAIYHDIKSSPYNDVPRYGAIPDGYKGSFTITRTKGDLEDLQIRLNEAFNAGEAIKPGYLSETVANTDMSVSRYQYTGVSFKIEEIAEVSREKVVKQTVTFMASKKVKLA